MKIVLLTYYFPPDQSVGSIRPENWARWLSEEHDVTVIAPDLSRHFFVDHNLPFCVFRPQSAMLYCLEFLNTIRKKLRKKTQISSGARYANLKKHPTGVLTYRMPCLHDFWLFSSYTALVKIKPDIVIATSGPYINLIAAWMYAVFHSKKILWLDYRDLWTRNHTVTGIPGIRAFEKILENRILRSAFIVTSVSQHLCNELRDNSANNVRLVYNAPISSFAQRNESFLHSVVTICYAGTIYPGWRDPSGLFERIGSLVSNGVISSKNLKLIFASRNAGDFFALVDEFSLREFIDYRGAVSREESISLQQQSDILLLLESNAPEARGVLTGKVFEYLMTDKPILLVGPGPDSELYQLLQKHDRLFTLDDLERFLRGEMKILPKGVPVDYSEISRKQLLSIMDSLVATVGDGVESA